MFPIRLLIIALFCISSVFSKKKICHLNDEECLTRAAVRSFKQFVAGIPGVETSDPLTLDLIEGNLPTLKYKLMNGSLSGMLKCHVDLVQFLVKEMKYNYHIGCPHLILESGACKVDIYDYQIIFNGDYEKFVSSNGKMHIQLKNHKLEYDAKTKVNYDCKNLFNGHKEKSDVLHKYANENWQSIHKLTRQPTMEAFMNKYIDNCNAYLKIKSFEDMFYRE